MRKTVHIIGSNAFGGAERFFLRLVAALAAEAWPTGVILRPRSSLAEMLPKTVQCAHAAMGNAWNPWYCHQLRRVIRSAAPQVVQTYMGRATRLTRLEPGRGVIHIARLGGYYNLKGYRHAHAWIGNTRGLCDYMIAQGLPAKRVFHIYNFVDFPAPAMPAKPIPGLPQDAFVLLAVGRLEPVKGTGDLLAAFAQLQTQVQDRALHLLVLGDGPLRGELQNQSQSLGLGRRVHWAGWQTDPGPYYRRADLVVFPSHEQETLGNVILETWAYAKPLLATRSRGGRELCRHGVDAWLTPCADVPALTQALRYVLAAPDICSALAQAGWQRVQRDFSRRTIVAQYQQLYELLSPG